jgi:ankyrin repeat protein
METQPAWQTLSNAVVSGDLELVKEIVSSKPMSARWSNQDQIPVVTLAVQNGHSEIVKLLVNNKARLNWTSPDGDENLYTLAKRLGHKSIADYLKPLMDPDLQAAVDMKARRKQSALSEVEPVLGDQMDDFSIFEKIQDNDVDSIQAMLANGIDVNLRFEDNVTPLIAAAGQGNLEIVRMLVEAGADVNALDAEFESALLAAKIRGFDEIERYLFPITNDEIRAIVEQQMES